jgi:hypothetical protein
MFILDSGGMDPKIRICIRNTAVNGESGAGDYKKLFYAARIFFGNKKCYLQKGK